MLEIRYHHFGKGVIGDFDSRGDVIHGTYSADGALGPSPEDVLDKLALPRNTPYTIVMAENLDSSRRARRERYRGKLNTPAALEQRNRAWDGC